MPNGQGFKCHLNIGQMNTIWVRYLNGLIQYIKLNQQTKHLNTEPFEFRASKILVFKFFQYSIGQYSDPRRLLFLNGMVAILKYNHLNTGYKKLHYLGVHYSEPCCIFLFDGFRWPLVYFLAVFSNHTCIRQKTGFHC